MSIAHAMNSEPPTANGTAMQANKTSVESKLNNGKKALLAMVNMGENSNIGRVLRPIKCMTDFIRTGINR